jgi:type IV secretion system protein VirB3
MTGDANASADQTAAAPRLIRLHASLTRPILMAGADRGLALANGVIALALVFGIGLSLATVTVAAAQLGVGHVALVLLAKREPDLRTLYFRHVQHAAFYPARPTEPRMAPLVHPSVPVSE